MTLAKLKISKVNKNESTGDFSVSQSSSDIFTCQFNPENFKIAKKNRWEPATSTGQDSAALAFNGGEPQNMTIALTFDSTDTGNPVFNQYSTLRKLSRVDANNTNRTTQLGAPSWVMVQWGSYMGFVAVITSLDEEYTFFKPDGTPLRAKVSVSLRQVAEESAVSPQNPTSRSEPRRTWVVQEGQRIDWIAYTEYGDSSAWRLIAEENHIDDPFNLRAGQVLRLPAERR